MVFFIERPFVLRGQQVQWASNPLLVDPRVLPPRKPEGSTCRPQCSEFFIVCVFVAFPGAQA